MYIHRYLYDVAILHIISIYPDTNRVLYLIENNLNKTLCSLPYDELMPILNMQYFFFGSVMLDD